MSNSRTSQILADVAERDMYLSQALAEAGAPLRLNGWHPHKPQQRIGSRAR